MTTRLPVMRGYASLPETRQRAIDRVALRDALLAITSWTFADPQDQAAVEAQITSLRRRLDDHGASVDEQMRTGHRFVQAVPDHRDPPSTVRWVVIQPDGTRTPRGARLAGEV